MSTTIATKSRGLLIPHEHGAWATLLMPYIVGVAVAGRFGPEAALFLLAAIALFAARYPLSLWQRARSRDRVARGLQQDGIAYSLAVYGAVATVGSSALLLVYHRWALLPLGATALLLLGLQLATQRDRQDRTVRGELTAFAGLTLAAPGAYYASSGALDEKLVSLWLLTSLYAGASVFYIKLKVRQRVQRAASLDWNRRMALGTALFTYLALVLASVVVLAATRLIPSLALLAFLPLIAKSVHGVLHATNELKLRRLGFIELSHTAAFAAVLIAAFKLQG